MKFSERLNKIFGTEKRHRGGVTIDEIAEQSMTHCGGGGMALMLGGIGSSYKSENAMTISAVYRAVETISDAIAQLPIETYKVDSKGYKKKATKHPAYSILNTKPNERMTRFTFIKLMVTSMLLKGNAYAYIMREKGEIKQLIWIPSEYVTVKEPQFLSEPITYSVIGINGDVPAKDMIHILNYTYNGIVGISTLNYAANSLGLAFDEENHARGFFSGGCAVGGVLKVHSNLNTKQKQEIKASWQQAFNPENGKPNSIAVLEGNMDYQPISVNPSDSQLLESRQFSVIEIARWFNISPIKLFDLTKSSYSTVEATNLSFLTDTLQPILQKFENEFETKLFADENIDVIFDVEQLLRADKQSLANYYNTLFNIGVMTPNEIRKQFNLLPIEGGDSAFVQANLLSVENAANNVPANSALTQETDETTDIPTV